MKMTKLRRWLLTRALQKEISESDDLVVTHVEVRVEYFRWPYRYGEHKKTRPMADNSMAAIRRFERTGLIKRVKRAKGVKAGYVLTDMGFFLALDLQRRAATTPGGRRALARPSVPRPTAHLGCIERDFLRFMADRDSGLASSREMRETLLEEPKSEKSYQIASKTLRVLESRGFIIRVGRDRGVAARITPEGIAAIKQYDEYDAAMKEFKKIVGPSGAL